MPRAEPRPKLSFTDDELDVLALALARLAREADDDHADIARAALAKVVAALPAEAGDMPWLETEPVAEAGDDPRLIALLRTAIHEERALAVRYSDKRAKGSVRTIWPLGIAYALGARVVVAWCELRGDFRHFRTDRLGLDRDAAPGAKFARPRRVLLAEWRASLDEDEFG